MAEKKCTSCNTLITNDPLATSFPCPKCGKEIIVRCGKCRITTATYKCKKCNFEGP